MKLSIVIATYQSESLLPRVFESLKKQDLSREDYEVLCVDGGSTDKTKQLAMDFGAVWVVNPRTEPVFAKFLSLSMARGRYLVMLDHDEVLESSSSLSRKLKAFELDKEVKVVLSSGYKEPQESAIANLYINEFGDPFSFFMYRQSKDHRYFLNNMLSRYGHSEIAKGIWKINIDLSTGFSLIETAAACTAIDLQFLKHECPEALKSEKHLGHLFYMILSKGGQSAILANDAVVHYSSETLSKFVAKIKWRIKNNIHHTDRTGAAGFTGRQKFQSNFLSLKKYLFFIYAFSIVLPVIDALYLSFTRRRMGYLVHTWLTLVTASYILYQYVIKVIGKTPDMTSYDGKKKIRSAGVKH